MSDEEEVDFKAHVQGLVGEEWDELTNMILFVVQDSIRTRLAHRTHTPGQWVSWTEEV